MDNINEFKNNDIKLSLDEQIKKIKKNNPGKFDHLPDPISRPQNWDEDDYQELIRILNDKNKK